MSADTLAPALTGPAPGAQHLRVPVTEQVLTAARCAPAAFAPTAYRGDLVLPLASDPSHVHAVGMVATITWTDRWDRGPCAHVTWPLPVPGIDLAVRASALIRAWATVRHAETTPAPKYGQAVVVLDALDGYHGQLAFVIPTPPRAAPTGPFVRLATGGPDVTGACLAVTRWAALPTRRFLSGQR